MPSLGIFDAFVVCNRAAGIPAKLLLVSPRRPSPSTVTTLGLSAQPDFVFFCSNHAAVLTSQVIFTQYYCLHSPLSSGGSKDSNDGEVLAVVDIAMASTLLASKSHECIRRVRDVVNAYHMLHFYARHRSSSACYKEMAYVCDEYYIWRDRATKAEMHILRSLGFRVQPVVLPTSLLASYLQALELADIKEVAQQAMSYLNDAGHGIAFGIHSMPTIVCAAICLALKDAENPIGLPPDWHAVFDVEEEKLEGCMKDIDAVYTVRLDLTLPLTVEETHVFLDELSKSSTHSIVRDTASSPTIKPAEAPDGRRTQKRQWDQR